VLPKKIACGNRNRVNAFRSRSAMDRAKAHSTANTCSCCDGDAEKKFTEPITPKTKGTPQRASGYKQDVIFSSFFKPDYSEGSNA